MNSHAPKGNKEIKFPSKKVEISYLMNNRKILSNIH